jgi:hypothetical protein
MPRWHGRCVRRCSSCTIPHPEVALETLEDHSHPAWQRLKIEELLAQQISQLQASRSAMRCVRRRCGRVPAWLACAAAGVPCLSS